MTARDRMIAAADRLGVRLVEWQIAEGARILEAQDGGPVVVTRRGHRPGVRTMRAVISEARDPDPTLTEPVRHGRLRPRRGDR